MITKQSIEIDLYNAMRSHDETTRNTIKLLLSSIKFFEIENQREITDSDILLIVQKEVKIRKETLTELIAANRPDLVDKANNELLILEKYLPLQLSDDEITELARRVIIDISAASLSDMGKVIKVLIPQIKGQASTDRISSNVRKLLS